MIGALLFGRILYVAMHFEDFGFNILKFLLINGYPGIMLIGSIAGGILTFLLFCYSRKIKFNEAIDYFVPGLFIALGFGKLGSFFSGVEVGAKTKFPLAMKYANVDGLRHLTPLYESILFFIACFIGYKLVFQIRREQYKKGFAFWFFCWYASMVFFALDPLKSFRLMVRGQSLNMTIALVILLTLTLYFIYYFKGSIFKKLAGIRNSAFSYGHSTVKKVHRSTDNSSSGGESKDS